MTTTAHTRCGTVYLVGAGPGDPGLLTLRAVGCLRRADVILCDYLADPAVLEHAPASAEIVPLGRRDTGRTLSPEEITARMLEEARGGRTVVRLKGGDPSVFGRGAGEIAALREAGVPYEIVPGVTAGLASAAYCEIPITHHEEASAVAIVAGREREEKGESHLDYRALASFPGTLIFYMGVGTVARWSSSLIEHGMPPDTPVAVSRGCTRADQRMVRCTLETVEQTIARQGLRPPSLFVVGKVVNHAPATSWFAVRPLFGTAVLVAGSRSMSAKLRGLLAAAGAEVILRPAIRITEPPDWARVDAALDRLDQYDWLVFSSGNGVDYLFRRLEQVGGDLRRLARVKLAVIGPGTAERLGNYHLRADLVPEEYRAESLADALADDAGGRRILLARASRGRDVLLERLTAAGADVDQVVVYSSVDVEEPDADVANRLASGRINWVTITSTSVARSLARLYGDALRSARLASISPITSAALRELGHEPAVEASVHTASGVVDAVLSALNADL
jgi:uroporphyrinogen III methyltransferase/synthase